MRGGRWKLIGGWRGRWRGGLGALCCEVMSWDELFVGQCRGLLRTQLELQRVLGTEFTIGVEAVYGLEY